MSDETPYHVVAYNSEQGICDIDSKSALIVRIAYSGTLFPNISFGIVDRNKAESVCYQLNYAFLLGRKYRAAEYREFMNWGAG